ncbi:hypothetical protein Syun_014202 [Stephania yunnanensis]|uniref:Uncharacterized protein n=1 Tax=Stephania yunnanensis TaxID=152371 RepID=A0AAP0P8J1_9MAGN
MAMMNRGDQPTGLSEFMMKKKGSGNDLKVEHQQTRDRKRLNYFIKSLYKYNTNKTAKVLEIQILLSLQLNNTKQDILS